MADRGALEAAAAAGVIKAEQVGPLHDFLASRAAGVTLARSGEEDLRFIRNFHDVFLAIGIALLAIGLAVGVTVYVSTANLAPQVTAITTGALFAGCAAVMWVLGEVFARRRRLFLPAIAIVCALTAFIVIAVGLLYAGVLLGRNIDTADWDMSAMPPELRTGILIAAAFAFIAPLAFYTRFRLPFSLGLAGGGVAFFVIVAAMLINFDLTVQYLSPLYLGLGLLLFAAGVAFDARDPARTSRYSDNGFWLHFAAAPLILNGAFGLIGQLFGAADGLPSSSALVISASQGAANATAHAALTLVVVMLLGIVSLLINRRVLIVSTLITTGIALGVLMNAVGLGAGALVASTLIVLGAFVLILGGSWHSVRRALLGWVKPDGAWARIFPPEAPATA
jgi:FtsH-binding integral membrane protein